MLSNKPNRLFLQRINLPVITRVGENKSPTMACAANLSFALLFSELYFSAVTMSILLPLPTRVTVSCGEWICFECVLSMSKM